MAINFLSIEETNKIHVLTDRVQKRKAACNSAQRVILFQRARSITRSWKETEADPNRIRWAKAFAQVLEDSAIIIREGELIVGCETKEICGAEIVPEVNPYDVLENLDSKVHRTMSEVMMASVDPDEAGMREVANFWAGRSVKDIVYRAYENKMGEKYTEYLEGRNGKVGVLPDVSGVVYKTQTIFAPHILKDGLGGIIQKARAAKEKTLRESQAVPNNYTAIYHKTVIHDAMVITCQAIIKYAHKHAALALSLAEKENDPTRKQELLEIAESCQWVPENPPRTFREALQFYWFIHMALRKEAPYHSGPCPARIDQWTYPYYQKDLQEGRLTRQQAAELLGMMWVKLNELQMMSG